MLSLLDAFAVSLETTFSVSAKMYHVLGVHSCLDEHRGEASLKAFVTTWIKQMTRKQTDWYYHLFKKYKQHLT